MARHATGAALDRMLVEQHVPTPEVKPANQADPEGLVRRATSHLRSLSYEGASIVLNDCRKEFLGPHDSMQVAVPVLWGDEVLGNILIPRKGGRSLSDRDRETLQTFAEFLAAGIANQRRLQEVLTLASTDPLTGTMNRRKLLEVGAEHMGRTKTTGVVVVDVDRLKTINDTFGHLAGDAVLKFMADRAKDCIRKTDFLARYGGDEFVILLPDTTLPSVLEIAERLRVNIQDSGVEVNGRSICFTVSAGLSCLHGAVNLQDIISRADRALYLVKQSGRNAIAAG